MTTPETRHSLLVRIRDQEDRTAWDEFTVIYRPLIVRLARTKGLQEADAEDLAQRVLLAVSGAIERWEPDGRARFRTWLKRIADNAILNALSRTKPDRGSGHENIQQLLNEHPDRETNDSALLQLEYRREIFQFAAKQVRAEFTETTWQAFWMTAVEAKSAEEVGRLLGRNRGSIYAAKSRVMRRLIQKVEEYTGEQKPETEGPS